MSGADDGSQMRRPSATIVALAGTCGALIDSVASIVLTDARRACLDRSRRPALGAAWRWLHAPVTTRRAGRRPGSLRSVCSRCTGPRGVVHECPDWAR